MDTSKQLDLLLPLVKTWAEEQEQIILKRGVPLNQQQIADARHVGVTYPELVRLHHVPRVPMPDHPALVEAIAKAGLISSKTEGMTLRYGIFIRADCWDKRQLIAHELVHTMQYERLGGFEAFLRPYLSECFIVGYPHGAMEQEAIVRAKEFLHPSNPN